MIEWKKYLLREISEINPLEKLRKGTLAKKVAMENILPFTKKIYNWSISEYKGGAKFRNCDTLFARITPCLENGKTAYVDFLDTKEIGFGSTEFLIFRPKEEICLSEYLYYLTLSPEFRETAIASMTGSSGRQRVQVNEISSIEFELPPLPEQKAIAGVLSSLDDKIDLLCRQNETLEALAQTIFRQWFIEEAEDDWKVSTLSEILTVKGGSTPSTKISDYWNGAINWATPKDLSISESLFLLDTERKITEAGLAKISSGLLQKGTLLLSSRAPVGYLAISDIPLAINQGFIAIIDDKGFSNYFIYLWLKENMDYVISYANGSTFMEISKSAFKTLKVKIPPKSNRKKFDAFVSILFEKIRSNVYQIRKLENFRDLLLPKLMSGEVRVRYEAHH